MEGGSEVGTGEGVSVGGWFGTKGVSVGVDVTGVGVNVAKRSCVGMRVTVGCGVGVSVGTLGVGEAISSKMGASPEQPLRKIVKRIIGKIFFMKNPLWQLAERLVLRD